MQTAERVDRRFAIAKQASILLALDYGVRLDEFTSLLAADFEIDGDSVTRWLSRDIEIHCDHREWVPGVPWDCTNCALQAAIAACADRGGRLFDKRQQVMLKKFGAEQAERWPCLRLGGTYRHRLVEAAPGLDAWTTAGLRRGVVHNIHQVDSISWLRGRAWAGMAWALGLRMSSDLYRLDRSALTPLPDGAGWRLRLGVSKTDQAAEGLHVRSIRRDSLAALVDAITEYVCVRDAAVGPEGVLILGGKGRLFSEPVPMDKPIQAAKNDLDYLALAAGLDPVYSSYSPRKGFVATAVEDEWKFERVRSALRHKKSDTTLRYMPDSGSRAVVDKLGRALEDARARA